MLGARPITAVGDEWPELVWKSDGSLRDDFRIFRIPVSFDTDRFFTTVREQIPDAVYSSKYGIPGWQTASLSSNNPDRLYHEESEHQIEFYADGRFKQFDQRITAERNFTSPVYQSIDDVWTKLKNYKIVKPRIVRLLPSAIVPNHVDGPNVLSVFAALTSNSRSGIFCDGVLHQIPIDGCLYVMNAGIDHHVFNFGSEDRYHLIFNMYPSDQPSPRALFERGLVPVTAASSIPENVKKNRSVNHMLNATMLADGGARFANWLLADLRAKDVSKFDFFVDQELVDKGAFGALIALISGLFIGARRAFFLHASATKLKLPSAEQKVVEFLSQISQIDRASPPFRENLKTFISAIEIS